MGRWLLGLGVACGLAFTFSACAGSVEESKRLGPGTHEIELVHDGRTRRARLRVPGPQHPRPLPVVVSFHGGGGRPAGQRAASGLEALADREGFVAVHPAGSGRRASARRLLTWNSGACCGAAAQQQVDDVGFAVALIDAVVARAAGDPDRVVVTGHSNGAMMALRVALQRPDRVAAVVSVGAAIRVEADLQPRVPLLHIHSVDDPRALYEGGLGPPFPFTQHRVDHAAVAPMLAAWASAAGCGRDFAVVDRRRWRDHRAERLVFPGCGEGRAVEHWRLRGAGHGWPGGRGRAPERLIGPNTEVIDASEEMWRFAQRMMAGHQQSP